MTGLKKKAFTMVELIIVIAIIAFLAVSATIVLTKFIGKSRDSRRLSDIGTIDRAITTFLADTDNNPTGSLTGGGLGVIQITTSGDTQTIVNQGKFDGTYLSKLDSTSRSGKFTYLQKLPADPKGTNYNYVIAIDAKGQKKYNIGATLEYSASDVIGNKTSVVGNFVSGDKILFQLPSTTLLTGVGSLIFSGNYNSSYEYRIGTGALGTAGSVSIIYGRDVSNTGFVYDGNTSAFPYKSVE